MSRTANFAWPGRGPSASADATPRDRYRHAIERDAMATYGPKAISPVKKFDEKQARQVGNTAVAGWFRGEIPLGRLHGTAAPNPIWLLELGDWVQCDLALPPTELRPELIEALQPRKVRGSREVLPLWWSEDMRACFVVRDLEEGPCTLTPTPVEDGLCREWQRGRPAKCTALSQAYLPPLRYAMPAIAIDYRSDKFETEPNRDTHYCHHHDPGVVIYTDLPFDTGKASVIMIRGGQLRLTKYGLDG